jgi:FkbM family methyltransferase
MFKKAVSFLNIDPVIFGYKQKGILNWESDTETGEKFLIEVELKKLLHAKNKYTFFDVGANKGSYSSRLVENFPNAEIHVFEPLPGCYTHLLKLFQAKSEQFFLNNVCVSDTPGKLELHTYANDPASQHASVYNNVLKEIHHSSDIQKFEVDAVTLDDYTDYKEINHIDFLKIDTEGHELAVLKGASRLLQNRKISLIQFEFNEMNIVSRVFFKDFYDMLFPEYNFFRLLPQGLLPIKQYDSSLEVFMFQNYLAVLKQR